MIYEDNSIPHGSPLGPFSAVRSPRGLPVPPPRTFSPTFAPVGDYEDAAPPQAFDKPGMNLPLPKAPPSTMRRPTPWDREHISETLLGMGAGFLSNRNFGDGLGNAAQALAGRNRDLRAEQDKAVSYGGPNDQFEITQDAYGNRTVREVPEFRAANERAAKAKNAPSAQDVADMRSRALYAIATQVPPEQRQAAYQRLLANPQQFGVDTTGMPSQWDDQYGTMGGMMGLNVNQSLTQERANQVAQDAMRHRQVQESQGAQRIEQGAQRVQQGAARVAQGAARVAQGAERNAISRQKAATGTKPRVNKITRGAAMGGYIYQGGDPADKRNWKAQ
ncbi:hypothetical protein [Sphingomonas parapaucimobilis]|uniref:hypothetical protein n=1 Tax=Sphingomonas parapaucimobilis TaxID=28213 RepID=UPI003918EC83